LLWFQRFSLGCWKRLGQDWRPNRALCNPLMVKLLNSVETKIRTTSNPNERLGFVVAGAYFCFWYATQIHAHQHDPEEG
jgi:hypothetical protein